MQTNDRQITELMKAVDTGSAQLPDFQRGWVWDDNRIKALIASITSNFPVGAAMFLEYGNADIRFKYRVIEGSPADRVVPAELILDGQQRITSMYSSLYSPKPVHTKTDKGKEIQRFYYIDIKKALDPSCDRVDAIISVPETRKITSNFGRKDGLWEKEKCPQKSIEHKEGLRTAGNLKITEDLGTAGGCKIVENHREIEDRKKAGRSWRKFTIIRQNPWQEIEEDQELTKNHRETGKKL